MFVLKSRLDAAEAEVDALRDTLDITLREIKDLKNEASMFRGAMACCQSDLTAARQRIALLRDELATTYVRDAKGRMARHPSAGVAK